MSPRTTAWLLGALLALLSCGLFVPQQVSAATIGRSYDPSVAQAIVALDLHRLGASWLVHLVGVLLGVNLIGLVLARVMNLSAGARLEREPDHEQGPIPGPGESARVDQVLAAALPRWSVVLAAPDRALAQRGLAREGKIILALGVVALIAAYAWAELGGTRGHIRLVTGDDQIAASRFTAVRLQGDTEMPWRPGFDMRCLGSADGTVTGPRQCLIELEGQKLQATVEPGRDLELGGYRLTLTDIGRVPHLNGFEMDVVRGDSLTRVEAGPAVPVDLMEGDQLIATLIPSGSGPGDPLAVLPAGEVGDLTVVTRPRTSLGLRVVTTAHVPLVWGGVALVLIGLGLVGLAPTYRVVATRRGSVWRLAVTSTGLLARPQHLADQVAGRLATAGAA